MTSHQFPNTKMVAIVCEHIAGQKCPVLSAFKTETIEVGDSGWQFFCGKVGEENSDEAKIWSLSEVLAFEPSIEPFLEVPFGTQIWREQPDMDWNVRQME